MRASLARFAYAERRVVCDFAFDVVVLSKLASCCEAFRPQVGPASRNGSHADFLVLTGRGSPAK